MKKVLVATLVVPFLLLATRSNAQQAQVCFCHNTLHNPITICTSDQGLINGHLGHVNNGQDTIGSCPLSPSNTPTATNTPTVTPTITNTPTPTNSPTPTITPSPTKTPTPTPTGQNQPTNTPTPTSIPTPTPTTNPQFACFVPQNPKSSAKGVVEGTSIEVTNVNTFCGVQTFVGSNNSGNNSSNGNVGGGNIGSGPAGSSTNQQMNGNSNSTSVSLFDTLVKNTVHIVNSGVNLIVNSSAN